MLHFLYHLNDTGTAGFVMATGELSSGETARLEVRKALVAADVVDCIVQLSGQFFANTGIPCSLWFVSKNRNGSGGYRKRTGEVLFIDGRKMGALIPGSRKQKQLADEEIERIASVYRQFKRQTNPDDVPGFCRVATVGEIELERFAIAPGRYTGSASDPNEDVPFEELYPSLVEELGSLLKATNKSDQDIRLALEKVTNALL
jgi:type I restriction enzyme M protein